MYVHISSKHHKQIFRNSNKRTRNIAGKNCYYEKYNKTYCDKECLEQYCKSKRHTGNYKVYYH